MRNIMTYATIALLPFISLPAFACGGGFGKDVEIKPAQTIVVTQRNGEETYIFQPHFCGKGSDFGLILPVPTAPTQQPTLGDSKLFTELAPITAPRTETVDVCAKFGLLGVTADSKSAADGAGYTADDDGVDVVATGTVGIFTFDVLKADSAESFTDWLDTLHFPYPASAQPAFEHYVRAGWYFVAFRVTASDTAPPDGSRICGDFGPIKLAFSTNEPVVPSKIATATASLGSLHWRIITIGDHVKRISEASQGEYEPTVTLDYAGELTSDMLTQSAAIGTIAKAGEWVTAMNVTFGAETIPGDIQLTNSSGNQPYRRVIYIENEVDCGVFGCNLTHRPLGTRWSLSLSLIFGIAALVVGLQRRKRRNR